MVGKKNSLPIAEPANKLLFFRYLLFIECFCDIVLSSLYLYVVFV